MNITRLLNIVLNVLAGFTVLILVTFFGLLWWSGRANTAPTDQSMIDTFQAHRAIFEELQEKICALPKSQTMMMDPPWSRPQVTDEVRDTYYHLFRQIGAKGIQSAKSKTEPNCAVSIEYWSKGWAGDADYKKYSFNDPADKDDIVADSLDDLPLHPTAIQSFRRELTDGWALRYYHWP